LTTLALDPESYNENYLPHTSTIGLVGHKALAGDSIKTEEAAWFKLNVKRLEEEKELFDVIAQRFPAQARVHGEKNATENGQEPSIIMPEDATERNKLVQNFFSSPNMEDTPENLAVLNAYLEKQIQMYARLSKEAQVMHQNDGIRYPGNFETFAGRTLVGVPEKGPNRFIFDVVRHRLNNSAMTIGEMQRMKFKEVARIIGLDLEHRFQDYDKYFS
jgi:hypothetical protein